MKLSDFAATTGCSQFGEDGIIEHIFATIGIESKHCVEFGAGDGLSCSNVAHLWQNGWGATLIEVDPERFERLVTNTPEQVTCLNTAVTSKGPTSIDALVSGPVDLMCIDVDGDDYWIWKKMELRPRVVCIEFNPTVPPHLALFQKESPGETLGFSASVAACVELGKTKGYTFIGASHCNAFFVLDELASPFEDYETDLLTLFPLEDFTFLVTDQRGNALGAGGKMYWEAQVPYTGPAVLGGKTFALTGGAKQTIETYLARFPDAAFWPRGEGWPNVARPDYPLPLERRQHGPSARVKMRQLMGQKLSAIVVDTSWIADRSKLNWLNVIANNNGYVIRWNNTVAALLKKGS